MAGLRREKCKAAAGRYWGGCWGGCREWREAGHGPRLPGPKVCRPMRAMSPPTRQDGSEDLLLPDAHVGLHVHKHGGLQVVALGAVGRAPAAGEHWQGGAVVEPHLQGVLRRGGGRVGGWGWGVEGGQPACRQRANWRRRQATPVGGAGWSAGHLWLPTTPARTKARCLTTTTPTATPTPATPARPKAPLPTCT